MRDHASVQCLIRNFGSGLGGAIQGTFTYRVNTPDNVVRVVFLMDGQTIGEDDEAPFRFQFHTDAYELGAHTMSAVGYTADGDTIESNSLQRQFVSGRDAGRLT